MANGYGLYDVAGNVLEWCNDWYDPSYYSISPVNNPTGPASSPDTFRVLRGMNWTTSDYLCLVAIRNSINPDYRARDHGFRICVFASH